MLGQVVAKRMSWLRSSVLGRAPAAKQLSTSSEVSGNAPTKYSTASMLLHWLTGAGVATCVATVKMSQWTPKDEPKKYGYTKMELMDIHKSTALLVLALTIPRIGFRLVQKAPPLPEGNVIEKFLGSASHFTLYALTLFLPISGIVMGYYGGKGLPFFGAHIPGAAEPNKDIAGQAYKNHKLAGQVLTYLVPIHIGAVGFHAVKGHNILPRMLP